MDFLNITRSINAIQSVLIKSFAFLLPTKFYEIFDTAIILAKGRQGSFLQVYHHVGVIFCAWASVRCLATPAFIGLPLDGGIHAVMVCRFRFSSSQPFGLTCLIILFLPDST